MILSRKNIFTKWILLNKYKSFLAREFNRKRGCFNNETCNFHRRAIERSNVYCDIFKANELNSVRAKDFKINNPKTFFKRLLIKIIMFLNGFPFLFILVIVNHLFDIFDQFKYVKLNKKDYLKKDQTNKSYNLISFLFNIILSPLKYYINFWFGYFFERWVLIYLIIIAQAFINPFVILMQLLIFLIFLLASPILVFLFFIKKAKKSLKQRSQKGNMKKIINFFTVKFE